MRIAIHFGIALALVACLASGCQLFHGKEPFGQGHSPLHPAQASSDSVGMEIIWVRFPADDPVLDDAAWREIDEAQIEPAVRRELVNNGLRAGVISGATMPSAITNVLHQGESRGVAQSPSSGQSSIAELLTEPAVHGRKLQLRRNQRSEIQASEVYPSLPLLVSGGTELSGQTYAQAQAVYALRVDPQPDRSATIELTPEVHFGAPQLKYTGDESVLRMASQRNREVFDRLRLSVKLAPGEMLVLMSLPDAGSRLGHYFHTADSAQGPQQKLILIRLADVPPSDTFANAGSF
jgi:hypothetical protein